MPSKSVFEMNLEEETAIMLDGVEGAGAQARIRSLIRRAKAAEARVAEAESAHTTALEAERKAAKRTVEEAIAARDAHHTEHLRMAERGLRDPRGRDLYRELWSGMDPKTRPATPADLFEQRRNALAESRKDKAKAAPKLEPWEIGYMDLPERKTEEVASLNAGAGEVLDWTPERIKESLGIRAKA